jgi:prevent-host-death family protein
MRTAGVAELKSKLTSFLKEVKAGREILITDRGTPVARLVPIDAAEMKHTRRQRLAAEGRLRLGKTRLPKALLEPPKGDPEIGAGVLAALIAERDETR